MEVRENSRHAVVPPALQLERVQSANLLNAYVTALENESYPVDAGDDDVDLFTHGRYCWCHECTMAFGLVRNLLVRPTASAYAQGVLYSHTDDFRGIVPIPVRRTRPTAVTPDFNKVYRAVGLHMGDEPTAEVIEHQPVTPEEYAVVSAAWTSVIQGNPVIEGHDPKCSCAGCEESAISMMHILMPEMVEEQLDQAWEYHLSIEGPIATSQPIQELATQVLDRVANGLNVLDGHAAPCPCVECRHMIAGAVLVLCPTIPPHEANQIVDTWLNFGVVPDLPIQPEAVGLDVDMLHDVRQFILQNPELNTLDMVLTFAVMARSATKWAHYLVAIKVLMKDLALAGPDYVSWARGFGLESPDFEFPDLDGFGDASVIRVIRSAHDDDSKPVDSTHVESVGSVVDRVSVAVDMLFRDTVVLAALGVFGTTLTSARAPFLKAVAMTLLKGKNDWEAIFRMVADLCKNSVSYLAYIYTGDTKYIERTADAYVVASLAYNDVSIGVETGRLRAATALASLEVLLETTRAQYHDAKVTKSVDALQWIRLIEKIDALRLRVKSAPMAYVKKRPYCLALEGPPGTGKTTFVSDHLAFLIAAYEDTPNPGDGTFERTYSPNDPKFWAGFTSMSKSVVYDDVFYARTPQPGDTTIAELLGVIGCMVTFAPMADVESKGKVAVTPSLVVLCENSFGTLSTYGNNYAALYRRVDLMVRVRYPTERPSGYAISFDSADDVVYDVYRYLVPRKNQPNFYSNEESWQLVFSGDRSCTFDYIRRDAHRVGRARQAEYDATMEAKKACQTCGRGTCHLPATATYDEHYNDVVPGCEVPYVDVPTDGTQVVCVGGMFRLPLAQFIGYLAMTVVCHAAGMGSIDAQQTAVTWPLVVARVTTFKVGRLVAGIMALFGADYAVKRLTWTVWEVDRTLARWISDVSLGTTAFAYDVSVFFRGDGVQRKIRAFRNSGRPAKLLMLGAIVALAIAWKVKRGSAIAADVLGPTFDNGVAVGATLRNEVWLRRYIGGRGPTKTIFIAGLVVGHQVALVPNHFFVGTTEYIHRPLRDVLRTPQVETINADAMKTFGDLTVFHDRTLRFYDGNVKIVALPLADRECILALSDATGTIVEVSILAHSFKQDFGYVATDGVVYQMHGGYWIDEGAQSGMCGSVLYQGVGVEKHVFAMLVASDKEKYTFFWPITDEVVVAVEKLRGEVGDGPSVQSLEKLAAVEKVSFDRYTTHPSSGLRWASPHAADFYGHITPEFSSKAKTKMVPTRFTTLMEEMMGLPNEFVPPVVTAVWDPIKEYKVDMTTKFIGGANMSFATMPVGVKDAVECVKEHYLSILADEKPRLVPLTVRESLNGRAPGIRGINRGTSAGGYIPRGEKRGLMHDAACEHYPNGVAFDDEVMARVDEITEEWSNGAHVDILAKVMPKMNEVRPIGKETARPINVTAAELTVALRRGTEPVNEYWRGSPKMKFMIGKSPVGADWGFISNTLNGVNRDVWIDADQKEFDLRQNWVKDILVWFFVVTATAGGYSERWIRMVAAGIRSMMNALGVIKGEVFALIAILISGMTATGEAQTIIEWFLMRVALIVAYCEYSPRDLLENFVTWVGGDDVLAALAAKFGAWRGVAFQEAMATMGYHVTSDSDKSKPPTEAPTDQVTIYKRKFRRAENGDVFAPLAKKSRAKMAHWRQNSPGVSIEKQHELILETLASEYFMDGPEEYGKAVDVLERISKATNLNAKFKPYMEMYNMWRKGTLHVWSHEIENVDFPNCVCFGVSGEHDVALSVAGNMASMGNAKATDAVEATDATTGIPARVKLTSLNPDLQSLAQYLKRPIVIATGTWTAGLVASTYPLAGLNSNTAFANKIANYYMFRFRLVVEVTISTPPTYMGVLAFGLAPQNYRTNFSLSNPVTASQVVSYDSKAFLDIAACSRVRLSCPWFAFGLGVNFNSNGQDGTHNLVLTAAEILPVVTSDGSPALTPTYTVYAWLEDVEALIPTAIQAVAGVGTTGLAEYMPSKVLAHVARVGKQLGQATGITAMTLAANVAGAAGALAEHMGFSNPVRLPEVSWVMWRDVPQFATGEAHDGSTKLSVFPTAQASVDRSDVDGSDVDAFDFDMFRRWGFDGTFTMAPGQTPGTQLVVIPVHPCLANVSISVSNPQIAPVGLASMTHDKWTGDLEFKIYVSSVVFLRGRIAIVWLNNVDYTLMTLALLNTLNPVYVDLSGSQEIDLVVPWGQLYPWLSNSQQTVATWQNLPRLNNGESWYINGNLAVIVVEPLVSNTTTTPTINFAVFHRAGPNFKVCEPCLDLARSYYAVAGVFPEGLARYTKHTFTGVIVSDKQLADTGGGELTSSFRPLVHRKQLAWYRTNSSVTSVVVGTVVLGLIDPLVWTSGTGPAPVYITFQSILASCYAAWRGAVRFTVQVGGLTGADYDTSSTLAVFRRPRDNQFAGLSIGSQVNGTTYLAGKQYCMLEDGSEVAFGRGSNVPAPCVSVDVPYASTLPVQPVGTVNNGATSGAAAWFTGFLGEYGTVTFSVYQALGDDFQFFGWTGVPVLTRQSPSYSTWAAW